MNARALLTVAVALLLTAGLTGCIGDDGEPLDPTQTNATNGSATVADTPGTNATNDTPASNGTPDSDDEARAEPAGTNGTDSLNPWQAGLAESYPTPDIAEHRSADERRSDVAEPGDPEFAAFDAKVQAWMEAHNISAGQLALMNNGELRYESGYGHTDRAETEATNASTMFRIASVTKPMTAALVSMQVEQGLYNWTDPVFCLGEDPAPNCRLPIDPHPDLPVQDERLEQIQVEDTIAHRCGFGDEHDDYLFSPGALEVANTLEIPPPALGWRTAQFMIGQELANAPGETSEYSNTCYLFAGLVAEAATGAELEALYDAYLFEPLEIEDDIEPARTLVSERNPREPFYPCEEGKVKSVFDPSQRVCRPNGSWSMQLQLAYGGLIATAEAVAAVYEAYTEHVPVHHQPEQVEERWTYRGHTGGHPGTSTGAGIVTDGDTVAQFVVLFNSRELNEHCRDPPSELDPVYDGPPRYGFQGGCGKDDLYWTMFHSANAWATAEDIASVPQAAGEVSP